MGGGTEQLQALMGALGYTFRDGALLRRALTHPSMGREDNQRLEFLGDAVLQYLMSDRLYQAYRAYRYEVIAVILVGVFF